ncbi:MAG: universal stress protein [Chromatiales bacterium]|nr:universal stress protein [Chromatiales bacterium]
MAIKTILLPLRDSDATDAVLAAGLDAAKRLDAHVMVLHSSPDPDALIPYATLGLSSGMRATLREAAAKNAAQETGQLRARTVAACERAGVAFRERGASSPERASASWVDETGTRSTMIAHHGRLADLIVVPRPSRMSPLPSSFEAALRDTGRPVLMVPRKGEHAVRGHHVGIAWNGSAPAAKAIVAAGPFLAGAQRISVLTTAKRRARRPSADEVVSYLACHGLTAQVLEMDVAGASVGEAMLATASREGIDLLVAGSYSRNRMRSVVFGGVTQHLLGHADLPVLMMY